MNRAVQRWREQARYDLETARAMLESRRYLYVLFCCQQSVEKALKALIVERSGEFPPRVHNLLRLCDEACVTLPVARKRFLGELSAFYIQSRYPEQVDAAGPPASRELASETLAMTEETIRWLFSTSE